ncbi:MAG: pilus assembly protein N-terminal domain-containing protein, partial [Halobacteriovoraceae bacterium]|nr:pilus assembly protein N-terminal domain-containing protein [Halobacteriovoraceae bacterium]
MENYFSTLSKWIVNLGVEPWLLFLAFLLLPIFTFLFSLLFLVTLVLETISQLLCAQMYCWYNYSRLVWHNLKSNNRKKLHTFKFLVKGSLYLSLLIDTSLSAQLQENQSFQRLIDRETSTLSLSKGEMVQFSLNKIKRFSIGNKEILSIKKLPSGNVLLLKAKALGQTYFYFWGNKGKANRIEVFVHSKRHLLSQKKIASELEKLGLSTQIFEKKIQVRGKIESHHQYNSFLHLHKAYKEKLIIEKLLVDKRIQLVKYSDLIKELSQKGLLDLDCSPKDLFIFCKASKNVQKSLIHLENRFLIQFPSEASLSLSKQYQVSL